MVPRDQRPSWPLWRRSKPILRRYERRAGGVPEGGKNPRGKRRRWKRGEGKGMIGERREW